MEAQNRVAPEGEENVNKGSSTHLNDGDGVGASAPDEQTLQACGQFLFTFSHLNGIQQWHSTMARKMFSKE